MLWKRDLYNFFVCSMGYDLWYVVFVKLDSIAEWKG